MRPWLATTGVLPFSGLRLTGPRLVHGAVEGETMALLAPDWAKWRGVAMRVAAPSRVIDAARRAHLKSRQKATERVAEPSCPRRLFCGLQASPSAQHVVGLAFLYLDHGVHGLDQLGEVGVAVVLGIEGGVEALDHVQHGSLVDPGLALRLGEQAHGTLEHLGGRVGPWRRWCVLGFDGPRA